jgi:hypothetical protein
MKRICLFLLPVFLGSYTKSYTCECKNLISGSHTVETIKNKDLDEAKKTCRLKETGYKILCGIKETK